MLLDGDPLPAYRPPTELIDDELDKAEAAALAPVAPESLGGQAGFDLPMRVAVKSARLRRAWRQVRDRHQDHDQPIAKALPRPGLQLRPTRQDPKVRRWQRVSPADVREGQKMPIRADLHIRVHKVEGDTARLAWNDQPFHWAAPTASVPRLVADLRGDLSGPGRSGHPAVDGALAGRGRFLGKGNEGVVVRVGDQVVKAATVAPYHPENGIRSVEEANTLIRTEAAAHEALADHPLIPRVHLTEHHGRAYLVKPYLNDPGELSSDELGQVQDLMNTMHGRGWTLQDSWQLGRDDRGQLKLMDLGSSRRSSDDGHRETDQAYLDRLYERHGQKRTPVGLELDRDLAFNRLWTLRMLDKQRPGVVLNSHWPRYERLAQAKQRELLAQGRDQEWRELDDELHATRHRVLELQHGSAAG